MNVSLKPVALCLTLAMLCCAMTLSQNDVYAQASTDSGHVASVSQVAMDNESAQTQGYAIVYRRAGSNDP